MLLKYKVTNWYLKILPFYLLLGILFSVFRSTESLQFASYYLGFIQGFDIVLFVCYWRYIVGKKEFVFVLILLLPAFFIGLLGNELDRHFLTDISNPVLFFSKCILFSIYWKKFSFHDFYTRFTRYAFYGSLILLPVVYYIFYAAGLSRLAVFPPMELPFSIFVINNQYYLILASLVVIFMYGKRAQLVAAIIGLLFFLKNVSIGKKILVIFFCGCIGMAFMKYFEHNLALQRLMYSFNKLTEAPDENMDLVSAGRFSEIDIVLDNMVDWMDYTLGKGLGVQFEVNNVKMINNIHFTPLSLTMKYGILFMLFVYGHILLMIFRKGEKSKERKIAYLVSILFLTETLFSYAIFVTPLFPVLIGYLKSCSDKRRCVNAIC